MLYCIFIIFYSILQNSHLKRWYLHLWCQCQGSLLSWSSRCLYLIASKIHVNSLWWCSPRQNIWSFNIGKTSIVKYQTDGTGLLASYCRNYLRRLKHSWPACVNIISRHQLKLKFNFHYLVEDVSILLLLVNWLACYCWVNKVTGLVWLCPATVGCIRSLICHG